MEDESDSEHDELESRVKYSFIVQEEEYEEEGESGTDSGSEDVQPWETNKSRSDFDEDSLKSADERLTVKPWDPSDIFFRIK